MSKHIQFNKSKEFQILFQTANTQYSMCLHSLVCYIGLTTSRNKHSCLIAYIFFKPNFELILGCQELFQQFRMKNM